MAKGIPAPCSAVSTKPLNPMMSTNATNFSYGAMAASWLMLKHRVAAALLTLVDRGQMTLQVHRVMKQPQHVDHLAASF